MRDDAKNAKELYEHPQGEDATKDGDDVGALDEPAPPLRPQEHVVEAVGPVEVRDQKPTGGDHEDQAQDRPGPKRRVRDLRPNAHRKERDSDRAGGYGLRPYVSWDLLAPHYAPVGLVVGPPSLLRLHFGSRFRTGGLGRIALPRPGPSGLAAHGDNPLRK